MSIYYFGELVGTYNQNTKINTGSEPTLVGDIVKNRPDYNTYTNKPKTKLVIRHFQEV